MKISFEVYPPRNPDHSSQIRETVLLLSDLDPEFISVTFGAGGSKTRESLGVLTFIRQNCRATPLAHLTCVGTTKEQAKSLIHDFLSHGVVDFLALRGDLPEGQTQLEPGTLARADQLVTLIEECRPAGQGVTGVAAFPNGHPESGPNRTDIDALLAKQSAGASFAITQLFFDSNDYFNFVKLARSKGVHLQLIPGIMPVSSLKRLERAVSLAGEALPMKLARQLALADSSSDAARIGADWAARQIRELREKGEDHVHLFAFNNVDLVHSALRFAEIRD